MRDLLCRHLLQQQQQQKSIYKSISHHLVREIVKLKKRTQILELKLILSSATCTRNDWVSFSQK